ncbi:MAG TPA: sensor histidine kinase [Candidatus Limnocylindria bacterium]|nr:sensor histidine kinase [Candidatus Limnocylindria bacterium]
MSGDRAARRPGWYVGADLALLALALALTVATTLIVVVPAFVPAVFNDRLDIAIITSATLVSAAVAAVAWARGRVAADGSALLRASAFTVLAFLNLLVLLAGVTGVDVRIGGTLDDPGQFPIFAGIVGRGTAAVLLALAGWAALRQWSPSVPAVLLVLGPAVAVFAVLAWGMRSAEALPAIVPQETLDFIATDPTMQLPPGSAPLLVILQSLIAAMFLAAALLAHRSFRRSGRAGDALLAAGLLIAAFSQINSAIHPGSYSSIVTTGDFLRLGFYLVLLAGVVAESRDDLEDLRAANIEVRRLADAQVAAVALEERARLAREIHDGLAQDLWYAKLKQARLAQVARLEGEPQQLSDEVADALDSALAEARHAVAAMRGTSKEGPLLDLLGGLVEDFADRFALRAELTTDGTPPEIGARAQAEVIRIVQEALTNVRKHADATVVRVAVRTEDGVLRITINDNGRGFHPEVAHGGFGLDSMRERAALISATLTISSQPQDGSRVELRVPVTQREGTDGS